MLKNSWLEEAERIFQIYFRIKLISLTLGNWVYWKGMNPYLPMKVYVNHYCRKNQSVPLTLSFLLKWGGAAVGGNEWGDVFSLAQCFNNYCYCFVMTNSQMSSRVLIQVYTRVSWPNKACHQSLSFLLLPCIKRVQKFLEFIYLFTLLLLLLKKRFLLCVQSLVIKEEIAWNVFVHQYTLLTQNNHNTNSVLKKSVSQRYQGFIIST